MSLILFSGMCKVSNQALSSLATETDVTDVIGLYHEFFSANQDGEANSLANEDEVSIRFGTGEKGEDPGVEYESSMDPEALAFNLGFNNKLPLLFNSLRHKGGMSPWSDPSIFDSNTSDQRDLEPLKLFWHQLAGIHAIIRMNFHSQPSPSSYNGTLIADEVGLGKTFQAITVLVFLADLVMRQDQKLPLPPIISSSSLKFFADGLAKIFLENKPYLGENNKIPSYPHLIVVAGTLLSQWESELKILIKPQSFDIFIYGSGKRYHENFWSPTGPFHSSKHPMSNRIIIASYTVHIHKTHQFYAALILL